MLLITFIVLLFSYSLFSRRLATSIVTAPMIFTAAGIIVFGLLDPNSEQSSLDLFRSLAEIGLVLLLFTDASRTRLHTLRQIRAVPARLLSVGMLLTILLGAIVAKLVFPSLSFWELAILAAILAPTDAGLGQVIVNSRHVPERVRESLNVEAGLNDGLSVPFLLFFMAMAAADGGDGSTRLLRFVGEQLGLGVVVGAGVGLIGGWLVEMARRRSWLEESFLQIAVMSLPILCLLLAEHVGASMFIAAFVAGLFVQMRYADAGRHSVKFTEEWGQIVNLSVFFLFGLFIASTEGLFTVAPFLYALLSLTVIRMLPVAAALAGTGLNGRTALFMGWFGPRGLASIVLGLVYLAESDSLPGADTTRLAVMATVLLSIFAHGLTAQPGIRLLAGRRRD